MRRHIRGLLRLVAATTLAVAGLAVAFVVAPAQGAPEQAPAEVVQVRTP
ncbi:hypothetical protein [Pseudactinotalea suaedae]|jgi:hypothetical protein|nr:hypothetical protein [Pseudactinotalea suaedae]